MGRMIEGLAAEYGFEVGAKLDIDNNAGGAGITRENLEGTDVAVEFSQPDATAANVIRLAELRIPVVIGTTGWLDRMDEVRQAVEQNQSAAVWAPNYAVGVNLFFKLVEEAARLLASHPEYGCWGWEIHHAAKKDAPSGTLVKLVNDMKAAGYNLAINTSSSRAGQNPGAHVIGFDSAVDSITLRHDARNREGLARGALHAAGWVVGKRGFFEFARDVLSLNG
jgi:4-hydroxy-tetrahydrodipicolinate reductase